MGVRQCGVRASARARTGPVTTATYRAMPAMVFTRARWPDGVRGSGERAGFRDRTAGARPWSGGTGRARPRSQAACQRALDRQVRRLLGGRHGHSPRNRALARATPALSASVTVMGRKVSGPAFYSLPPPMERSCTYGADEAHHAAGLPLLGVLDGIPRGECKPGQHARSFTAELLTSLSVGAGAGWVRPASIRSIMWRAW